MKLSGWVRIGIVLSILWVAVVAGRLAYEAAANPDTSFIVDRDYYEHSVVPRLIYYKLPDFSKFGTLVDQPGKRPPGVARPWSAVSASAEFKSLALPEKEAARNEYFDEVVAPKVADNERATARAQFDKATRRIFSFTSPEGKSYDVAVPQGATKEQAFQVLQENLLGDNRRLEINLRDTIGKFLVASAAPLAALWFVVWLAVVAVRWIRAGFNAQGAELAASGVDVTRAVEDHLQLALDAEAASSRIDHADNAAPLAVQRARPPGWRKLLRWIARAVAIILALIVNGVWLGASREIGLGAVGAAIGGGLVCWFLFWVWAASRRL